MKRPPKFTVSMRRSVNNESAISGLCASNLEVYRSYRRKALLSRRSQLCALLLVGKESTGTGLFVSAKCWKGAMAWLPQTKSNLLSQVYSENKNFEYEEDLREAIVNEWGK
eukprot:IDg6900t1